MLSDIVRMCLSAHHDAALFHHHQRGFGLTPLSYERPRRSVQQRSRWSKQSCARSLTPSKDSAPASASCGSPRNMELPGSKPPAGAATTSARRRRPVHRSSSPSARWLLFVVKGFSNFGSRRMRSIERWRGEAVESGDNRSGWQAERKRWTAEPASRPL